uniref:C2H2-type domain-containing protein n=1 Tax=Periophthalmus magnuspinnatus TaxID=409849 RepID=A0A3B4A8V5_9GOBI
MAENNVDPEPEWIERAFDSAEDTLVAMENLLATLRAFEDVLRQQDISIASSIEYCDNFCQALMHYAGSRNSMDHGLPLLEVYCLSINCFASARSHLTAESDKVELVLKRLALSCFELFLSVPENEIPYEAWLQFHQSLAHGMLLEYGSTDLQALVQITGEGGAWSNPVLTSLLTGQPTNTEEVDAYICLEGEGFMEMRVKHLEKIGEVAKAVVLAKACVECNFISNKCTFRQTYVSLLCHLLPSEEAISEISRLDCKDVLEITCNLETEGDENTAFILCTTFLTQQLQQQNLYCSWELILLWSKLQRRLDPTLLSFLERCLQLGAIAKTVYHLLYLVRVIQTEVEDLGVAPSVELCVKALQLPKQDDSSTRISVCKTVSCLLADDLEVCRACQLTEFLLSPSQEVFRSLEELYLRPDQKNDQENMVIPNSLRCELLLALKSYWPFDPEFWDWKTLKHQCISLLGLKPESEEEDGAESQEKCKLIEIEGTSEDSGSQNQLNGVPKLNEKNTFNSNVTILSEKQYHSKTKRGTFQCQICKRSVTDAQLVHHSKRHSLECIHPCPICLQRFNSRKQLVPHLNQHIDTAVSLNKPSVKAEQEEKHSEEDEDTEPGEIPVDPSLMMYYKSTHDPDVLDHIVQQVNSPKKHVDSDEHITFDYIYRHYHLQNRDEYPCPGTSCSRVFKHSKYLNVHLKSEHRGDENVKYFHKIKDKREKCAFCRKHLMSTYHYRKHRKAHCGDQPHTCLVVGCGAQFVTSSELFLHKQTHGYQLNYQCELKGCYVTFSDLGQLYHHEAQHFRDAAFTCTAPKCKKYYFSKTSFTEHLATHNIHFSEQDFEAQKKAKRKQFKSSINDSLASQISCDYTQSINGDLSTSAGISPSENREAKTTLVAVCFDGSKFTCGFEKCGMTFSRARDVQRHLKCAHPEHLKMENKEHKHDREQGFKSKGVKHENKGGANKGQNEPKMPCLSKKTRKEKKMSSQSKNPESSALHEALKEIINGLCKLDLNCPSSDAEPPEDGDGTFKSTSAENTNSSQEVLTDKKPHACKICEYRGTKKYNLMRHYMTHGYTREQATKLSSPYICHFCFKSYDQKDLLRDHYIQIHDLEEILVNEICGFVGDEESKPANSPENASLCSSNSKSKEAKPLLQPETKMKQDDNCTSEKEQGGEDKVEQNTEEKEESEGGEIHQGRAKRLAKSNLCYILDKFNKPFHCVAKNCDAAFSAQGGLVRHLQMVHHYNRSQLLLENECDEQSSEVKKEHSKKRSAPISDEPQPQYKCHFANCHVSYHLKSSLARHTRDCHSQPEVISKYDSHTSVGSHDGELKKHVYYNHCEYYNSLVVRLQSTRKDSVSGCQKKLIVPSQSPLKEEPDLANTQNGQPSPEPKQNEQEENVLKTNYGPNRFIFKSHEEALQMCQDRCLPEAYPCLVQDCDTVVGYRRSLRRHYLQVHHMGTTFFVNEEKELILNAEQLEEMIQRKSVRPTRASSPNGVRKMEYQTEPENPGGESAPMSLHCIKTGTPDETHPDPLVFPEEVKEEQPSVERNSMLVGADDVLYGEPSTDGHTEEATPVTQNIQKQQERLSLEQIKPFLRPVTVDLSPPSSLRFITEKGFNRTVSVSIPRIREPLKRKNDLSEQPSNVMDAPHNSPHKPSDVTAYKPVGFESSFMKFIQETVPKEKTVTSSRRQNSFRRSCSVKENNQLGIAHTRKRTHSPLLKPHTVSGDTSNLRSILDKALAGCGDLAIKQLQYLRPVVVLGRPVCSTTLSFTADTNKSKLLLGS